MYFHAEKEEAVVNTILSCDLTSLFGGLLLGVSSYEKKQQNKIQYT